MIYLLLTVFDLFISTARADFLPSSFSVDYEEISVSSATGKEKKSLGKIDYQYPKHIRAEVLSPDPSTFVANPTTSWHYTPPFIEGEEGQVKVQKADQLPMTKFLDALKNGNKSNSSYSVSFSGKQMILTFSEALKKQLSMKQAILVSEGEASQAASLGDYKELLLEPNTGKRTRMKFISFRTGVSFAADHFTFRVPPKTKIVGGK